MVERQSSLFRRLHALRHPELELLDGFAADGEFNEMDWHGRTLEHDPET
jgi:hypothetical protein